VQSASPRRRDLIPAPDPHSPQCDFCIHSTLDLDTYDLDCAHHQRVTFRAPAHPGDRWGWFPLYVFCGFFRVETVDT
jgi:hypothetical protein